MAEEEKNPQLERKEKLEIEKVSRISNQKEEQAKKNLQDFFSGEFSWEKIKEGLKRFSSGITDPIKKSKDVLLAFFASPFENKKKQEKEKFEKEFDPLSYLQEFYQPITTENVSGIMESIQNSETKTAEKSVIDLKKLTSSLWEVLGRDKEINLESLENYCIYDFLVRKAIPKILEYRPQDHFSILDIGGGPSIYQHIPLMGIAKSITHSEFLQSNRQEIEKWLANQSQFDWESYFRYFQLYLDLNQDKFPEVNEEVKQKLRSFSQAEDPKQLSNLLRSLIRKVVSVDVFQENLGMTLEENPDLVNVGREGNVELMTANFCVESATANRKLWKNGIKNICSKVSSGGFLIMTAIRNAKDYKVGNKRLPAVEVNAESLSKELVKNGMEIMELSEVIGSEKKVIGYDGMVFVLARKR